MTCAIDELFLITCYYNPNSYISRRLNYERFLDALVPHERQLRVIECAFGDDLFQLPPAPGVIHVRGTSPLWQKERLLNIAIASLPKECRKVVWLDCDVFFENPDWFDQVSTALDYVEVLQPFSEAVMLPKGEIASSERGEVYKSFASIYCANPQLLKRGNFELHGHTGFAWAARRDWLSNHGLYDRCITGCGDHLMAHAMCGDLNSPCIMRMIGNLGRCRDHFGRWAEKVYEDIRGNVGVVRGRLYHLWHGQLAERRYEVRNHQLLHFEFDPERDIRIGAHGTWEWASYKPALHAWAEVYFTWRNEDGTFKFVDSQRPRFHRFHDLKP